MNYLEFIENKRHSIGSFGFDAGWFPECAFDFQKHIISKSVKKGRYGVFADTGLGKTLIELSIAQNIVEHTNRKVLILTPLAVAFQFVKEAEKIGISDIEHCKDGNHKAKIVVMNYERLHLVEPSDFECVILDESSILKNFNGKIKSAILAFIRKVNYRFLASATPSPNDFTELGNSSEALGYMGYLDMIGKFFKSTQNDVDSNNRNIGNKFRLLSHAEQDFFAWVNQWSIMVRKPSDIGFSNEGYELPPLTINNNVVKNKDCWEVNNQLSMFVMPAKTMTEVKAEQKKTVNERCERAVELAEGKTSVYWCNLNDESDRLAELDKEAFEIRGSMSIDAKEDALIAFANGEIKRLITKAKMTSMGLNWQHCNHTVFFPTWSYEQYYQAIRRFWRFGQKKEVVCDLVISEGQERVIRALHEKIEQADRLYQNLTKNVNKDFKIDLNKNTKKGDLPRWLK